MKKPRRSTLKTPFIVGLSALAAALTFGAASAQATWDGSVKLGLLSDMSGVFANFSGPGSIVAAQMSIDDCLKVECKGMKIELLTVDHQNKTDLAIAKAREWADIQKVDAYVDMVNSAVALAMANLAVEKNKIALFVGGPVKLTNEDCHPQNTVQWMWDTFAQVSAAVKGLAKPGQKWFFITVDYAYGKATSDEARKQLEAAGATVVGEAKHTLNAADFSSQILAAKQSGADVVAFINSGSDVANALKAAREFDLGGKQILAAFIPTIYEIQGVGLETAQGLTFPESFYWNVDDGTRRFAQRFVDIHKKGPPSLTHAGVYSSVYHYLKSVAAAKSTDTATVMKQMHTLPIKDDAVRNAKLRVDGRMVHDYYLFKVKAPAESKEKWDLYNLVRILPGDDVFLPLSQSQCPAVKTAAK